VAILTRTLGWVTVTDLLRHRDDSPAVQEVLESERAARSMTA
jgi:hypothetical protein